MVPPGPVLTLPAPPVRAIPVPPGAVPQPAHRSRGRRFVVPGFGSRIRLCAGTVQAAAGRSGTVGPKGVPGQVPIQPPLLSCRMAGSRPEP